MDELTALIAAIPAPDAAAIAAAARRQAGLAKPPGSLGRLEDISIKLAGITGQVCNFISRRRIIVLCADNGVVAEGVSSAPRSVTAAQAVNMTKHRTGMSSMAYHFGNQIEVVDVGIAEPYDCPDIINRHIADGTRDLAHEPAMTREETMRALFVGVERAEAAKRDGIQVVGVGEMGIGNTTTSAAVLAALTGLRVEAVTGRGGGLSDAAFAKKKKLIRAALRLHKPDRGDVIDVLSKVGGLDIAAMCGVFLGCAMNRLPVVIDGFISVVAALCACRLCPAAAAYMFPSHASYEPGYTAAIRELGMEPWLLMGMRLGEGSGCPIAFEVMDAACAAMNGMASFGEDADIDDGYLEEIRRKDSFTV